METKGRQFTVRKEELRSMEQAEDIIKELMTKYLDGLGWKLKFGESNRRAGCCNHKTKTLMFPKLYVRNVTESELRNTILHEIAHALVGLDHNHDQVWKEKAISIGCNAEVCHTIKFGNPKYLRQCPKGCRKQELYGKPKVLDATCPKCLSKAEIIKL